MFISKIDDIFIKLGCQETHTWLYALLEQIPKILENTKYTSDTYIRKTDFESSFEKELINKNLKNISKVVNNYKLMLYNPEKLSKEDLVTELNCDSISYPCIKLFRVARKPNIKSIITMLTYQMKPDNLIKIFFSMHEQVKILKAFYPILRFSNYLIDEYNHRISRDDAKGTEINILLKDEKIIDLFDKFIKAWEKLPKDCLQYSNFTLQKPYLSIDSTLNMFLIDNKEKSSGMHIA
ncbi:hypothetical protein SteCoe_29024 [Stentor coeruleus]|uniref:Uncharacterized protein n=1 Tax=Stentor coeruleus TaxID=5963 RepID=A0A1R2B707_9CILI|nr:hypothetical protein SteCoe_29024 [Stentor coeruleus]